MPENGHKTYISSVLFLDIAEYSRKPVSEQIRIKDRLNAALAHAIRDIDRADRIILDTGDGAAISFLGDPEDALLAALDIRAELSTDADGTIPRIRMGINLGPVRLTQDINGHPNIVGDGINVAQRVMGFAEPGQVLASRAYQEVISRLSDNYARLFAYEGSRTDKHVREHEIYVLNPVSDALLGQLQKGSGREAALGKRHPAKDRRVRRWPHYLAAGAALALMAALTTAIFVGKQKERERQATEAEQNRPVATAKKNDREAQAPEAQASRPGSGDAPANRRHSARAPQGNVNQAAAPRSPAVQEASAKPAHLVFAVAPWGEIFIDGKSVGVSPPLTDVPVPPGRHQVEIRNDAKPPHALTIEAGAGESIKIKHKF